MFLKKIFKNPFTKKPLENKPILKTITFASYPEKKVDRKYIDIFWKNFFSGKLEKNVLKRRDKAVISKSNISLKIFALSPTVTVTLRKLDVTTGRVFLKIHESLNQKLKNTEFKYSQLVLADIIDYKIINQEMYIMERIIPSLTVYDFLFNYENMKYKNRFQNSFINKIKTVDENAIRNIRNNLGDAFNEIKFSKIINEEIVDFHSKNIIVIDYNQKTNKFKLGLIDIIGTESRSF